jgi:hypothetical protein
VCPKWFPSLRYNRRKPCTYLALRLALSLRGPKWPCTWVSSPSLTIRCVQDNFWAYGTSSANHARILHRHLSPNEKKRDSIGPMSPRSSIGASKMISTPMVRLMQTVHPSWIKISTISKRTDLSLGPRHLGLPLSASETIFEPMICLAQTVHLSCIDTNIVSKRKEVRFHMTRIT